MSASTKAFAVMLGGMLCLVMLWAVMHPVRKTEQPGSGAVISTGLKVDLNTDDAAMLTLLPGVGPSIAQNIVEAREGGAVFDRAEDLEPVKYIGPSLIRRVQPWVVGGTAVGE